MEARVEAERLVNERSVFEEEEVRVEAKMYQDTEQGRIAAKSDAPCQQELPIVPVNVDVQAKHSD